MITGLTETLQKRPIGGEDKYNEDS